MKRRNINLSLFSFLKLQKKFKMEFKLNHPLKNIRKPFDIYHRKNSYEAITSENSSHLTFIEGHRGIDYKPENTLLAYKTAIEAQCDCIELDVWLSKDKIPVVIHAGKFGEIEEYSNGTGNINNFTLREIKQLKVKNSEEDIPTLQEVFDLCKEKIFINIEMKDLQVKEALKQVIKLIEDNKMENQICISSFISEYLEELKILKKEIEYGFLIEAKIKNLNLENYPIDIEHRGTVNLHYSHCTKENVEFIRKNKLGVHVWFSKNKTHYKDEIVTENEEAYKKLLALEVDVICTNYPDVAIKVRQEFMEAGKIKVC
jgi:glycerophosphoryl diester phosphodiesterase